MTTDDKRDDAGLVMLAVAIRIMTSILVKPFAVVTMWRWYAVPFGLPVLTWVHGWAIVLTVAVFTSYPSKDVSDSKKVSGEKAVSWAAAEVAIIGAILAFGWLALKLTA